MHKSMYGGRNVYMYVYAHIHITYMHIGMHKYTDMNIDEYIDEYRCAVVTHLFGRDAQMTLCKYDSHSSGLLKNHLDE